MSADLLDLFLLAAIVVVGIGGYRQGLVVDALSLAGLILGGIVGLLVAPPIARAIVAGNAQALVALGLGLVLAILGQLLGTTIGTALRQRIVWKPARLVDSAVGAFVAAAGVLLIAWVFALPVSRSSYTGLNEQVRRSVVMRTMNRTLPPPPPVFDGFLSLFRRQGFPEVFSDLGPTRVTNVPAPDPRVANARAVVVARDRVLKVTGVARSCSRRLEGTAFVYAPEHLMTNAHVVAGVKSPQVEVRPGDQREAKVVLYDPGRDIAVLYVRGLTLAPLAFAGDARSGDSSVVVGYPEDGPFRAEAARVRERITAVGRDIYDRRDIRRDVYSLRTRVRPGNSGGPLLAPDGRVYGVIFAAAADDPATGYALTATEVRSDADAGRTATASVSTQSCD
ncbi:MAG TPA: MarP family serine protease [Mycobacteriales bacterium]|nr:MarP family serine protease [Mycobacteriales bacterium]